MKRGRKANGAAAREDVRAFIAMRRLAVRLREATPGIDRGEAGPLLVYQGGARWAVNVHRLREIEEALARQDPVDAALREELQALAGVLAYQQEAQLAKRPGAPADRALRDRAAVVLVLHRSHGVKLEAAINAVARQDGDEEARRLDRQNLKAKYHRLKDVRGTVRVLDSAVRDALDRLNVSREVK